MRTVFFLSLLASVPLGTVALSADDRIAPRHGGGHHDDHDEMMAGDSHMMDAHDDDEPVASTSTAVASAAMSSASTPSPASSSAAHKHAANEHNPHSHHSHSGPVKEHLDDADIHYWHDFPPTYMDADFRLTKDSVIFGEELPDDWDPDTHPSHPGLMIAHVLCMMGAYFVLLPIALALRAANHPSHYLANGGALAVAILGWFLGVAYKAAMPDMYPGAKHGSIGTLLLLTHIALTAVDSLALIKRGVEFWRSGNRDWKSFFHDALHSTREDKFVDAANRYEMVGMIAEDDDEPRRQRTVFAIGDDDDEEESRPRSSQSIATSRHSTGSEGTLQDSPTSSTSGHHNVFEMGADRHTRKNVSNSRSRGAFDQELEQRGWTVAPQEPPAKITRAAKLKRSGEIILTWIRRTQVIIAYVAVCTAIPTYVGMCRAGYINTCAAHIIKGSIFFGYGVLTFARYLGAYADLGWAWNRKLAGSKAVSAEMVECAVIFTYGITNTWMERFGAKPGDPYTVKQVQHISIAIMFWFGGLSGMLLESKRVRRILASSVTSNSTGRVREPASYAFSFNPFPALVIAITGLAMAAHHQDYVFQVKIHSLWGILLAGGSAFRFLTYFYLWLRPPTDSMMPSRPPTEVLTSFGWTAGGIVFMLSDEEVAFAAMRSGFDDMMAFLNVTVALTCLVFCWIVVVMAIKGVAVLRIKRGVQLAIGDDEERV